MNCDQLIHSENSVGLRREESNKQLNNSKVRVLGINVLGARVPIIFNVLTPNGMRRGIVFTNGTRKHKSFVYEDIKREQTCVERPKFLVDYWRKKYLCPRVNKKLETTVPYKKKHNKFCIGISDNCGRELVINKTIHWREPKMVWVSDNVNQTHKECEGYPVTKTEISIIDNGRDRSIIVTDKVCRPCKACQGG